MSTYKSFAEYTADLIAAREAYAADQQCVAAGYCETGDGRKKDGRHRQCWTCRHPEGRVKR